MPHETGKRRAKNLNDKDFSYSLVGKAFAWYKVDGGREVHREWPGVVPGLHHGEGISR